MHRTPMHTTSGVLQDLTVPTSMVHLFNRSITLGRVVWLPVITSDVYLFRPQNHPLTVSTCNKVDFLCAAISGVAVPGSKNHACHWMATELIGSSSTEYHKHNWVLRCTTWRCLYIRQIIDSTFMWVTAGRIERLTLSNAKCQVYRDLEG